MKKLILAITFIIATSQITAIAFVADPPTCTKDIECGTAEICRNNKCTELVPRLGEGASEFSPIYEETGVVGKLPEVTLESAFSSAIKTILTLTTALIITALVITGVYYLKSRGQEEDITKAKTILIYIIMGVAFMAAAYGVITGISQFKFF